jgi:hypothetical protein
LIEFLFAFTLVWGVTGIVSFVCCHGFCCWCLFIT